MKRMAFVLIGMTVSFATVAFCDTADEDDRSLSWLHPAAHAMPTDLTGPFVRRADGALVTVDRRHAVISEDEGETWQRFPLFADEDRMRAHRGVALHHTDEDVLVAAFMNMANQRWGWDDEANAPIDDVRLFVYSIRSVDGGRNWSEPLKVQDGYCGSIRDMIQTRDGTLVLGAQRMMPELARHVTITYASTDQGQSWHPSNALDLDGRGHHDGIFEATLEQLNDGRLWLLLRTSKDYFWEAFSGDDGRTWSDPVATTIDASASPGMLKRLASGRLVLVWNRLFPEGVENGRRRNNPNWAAVPVSVHRNELSIAFSEDDGATWSDPVVFARGDRVAYPHVFEVRPGTLWVTTIQGLLRIEIDEADLLQEETERE